MLQVGDIVYLKSDFGLKCPMTVVDTEAFGNEIAVKWNNSQKKLEVSYFKDPAILIQKADVVYTETVKEIQLE